MSEPKNLNLDEDNRPLWVTPVIDQDSVTDSTRHYFGAGIDNYEGSNPVGYGS
jgi:hypothetical protein